MGACWIDGWIGNMFGILRGFRLEYSSFWLVHRRCLSVLIVGISRQKLPSPHSCRCSDSRSDRKEHNWPESSSWARGYPSVALCRSFFYGEQQKTTTRRRLSFYYCPQIEPTKRGRPIFVVSVKTRTATEPTKLVFAKESFVGLGGFVFLFLSNECYFWWIELVGSFLVMGRKNTMGNLFISFFVVVP